MAPKTFLLILGVILFTTACKKHDTSTPQAGMQNIYMVNPHLVSFAVTDTLYTYNQDSSGVYIVDTLSHYRRDHVYIVMIDTYSTYAFYDDVVSPGASDTFFKTGDTYTRSGSHGFSKEIISFKGDSITLDQRMDTLPAGSFHSIISTGKGSKVYIRN